MLRHRCPWCGEYLPAPPVVYQWIDALNEPNYCPKCRKPYSFYSGEKTQKNKISIIILLCELALLIFVRFMRKSYFWHILPLLLFLTVIINIQYYQSPFGRYYSRKEKKTLNKQKSYTQIFWNPHKDDGLSFPKMQIAEGEIFPACFLSASGQPISTALCIVLEDIKWKNSRCCNCNIHLVLDDVSSQELFQKGNTFHLYHNYRLIAKGTVQ